MKNGIPEERAFAMEDAERFAFAVTFATFEGQEFDWQALRWKKPPGK